jgi:hypothetical protein
VIEGSVNDRNPATGSSNGSVKLEIGSQWSVTPNTKINSNDRRVAVRRGDHAERNRHGEGDQHREHGELEAGPHPSADVVEHRLVAADRSPQIALCNVPNPGDVLDVERLIEPELTAQRLLRGRVLRFAQHGLDRIPWHEVNQQKHPQGHQKQHRDRRHQPANDEASHSVISARHP